MRDCPPRASDVRKDWYMGSDSPTVQLGGKHADRRRRLVTWSLVGAALLYNAWIIESAIPTPLDPRHSYVSELYAADQSSRPLFAALELCCAALIVVGTVAWRRHDGGLGWWALTGFGLCSVADALFPLDCAPSLEPGCSAVHPVHTVTSALVHFFLFASMGSLAWWARRHPGPRGPGAVGRWGLPLMGAAMLSAVATVGPLLGHPGWHGVPQRLHLTLVGGYLLLLAYGVRAGGSDRSDAVAGDAEDAGGATGAGGAEESAGVAVAHREGAADLARRRPVGLFRPARLFRSFRLRRSFHPFRARKGTAPGGSGGVRSSGGAG